MANDFSQVEGATNAIRGQITQISADRVKAPKNIIQTVAGARSLFLKYRYEHLKRIDLYARIEGLIAGNPPYNPTDLEKHGLGHIANFNNLDGRALYERGALAYWNLLNETETLCKFEIRGQYAGLNEFADIMAKNWNYIVRQWPSFYTQMNTLAGQLVKFGISPVIWPDERDWRWRTIELSRFYVTDQAQSDIEQLTAVFVETTFTAQYLYEVYLEFKDKPDAENPWNMEELVFVLLTRANQNVKTQFEIADMMDIQRRIQNGDVCFDELFTDSIRIISGLYKEYDEEPHKTGITHFMFDRFVDKGNFLFKADRVYDTMTEALVVFTASPGEFTIHSNRGLGHKIFSGCQAMMQLDCDIINMARMSSTPLIKSLATGSRDFEAIRFYPGVPTNIGTAEFQQNNLGANINQLIAASQYMLGKLQYNTANSGDDPSVPDNSLGSISPTQARMESYKEFGVLKHNIAHFYSQCDIVYRNMTAKMLGAKKGYPGYEEAKEWKERCIEDGVPEEIFQLTKLDAWKMPRHLKVKASRVAGDGSTLARIMALQELSPIAGDFGPREAREYKRQWIMATMGPEYVPVFMQESDDVDETAGGASLAGVENGIMRIGESPVFSPDNEHRAHFVTHLALGNDTIQQLQQQQTDPVAADKIFTVLIPHMEEHFIALQKSPFTQTFVQGVTKPWRQLFDYAKLNRKNAASMLQAEIRRRQEAQAEQDRVLSKEELENIKVQGDERRANFKVQSTVQRAKEASDTRAEIMKESAKRSADNERLKIQLENNARTSENKLETEPLPDIRQDLANINGTSISPNDFE